LRKREPEISKLKGAQESEGRHTGWGDREGAQWELGGEWGWGGGGLGKVVWGSLTPGATGGSEGAGRNHVLPNREKGCVNQNRDKGNHGNLPPNQQ